MSQSPTVGDSQEKDWKFTATGEHSKFLLTVQECKIVDREGTYQESITVLDRYVMRPTLLGDMCLAQFAISYDMMTKAEGKKKDYEDDGCSREKSKRMDMKIVSYDPNNEKPLPLYIKLGDDLGYMRLRDRAGQSVLRRYKIQEKKFIDSFFILLSSRSSHQSI